MAKRKLTMGILAHVDAGKTTLSEALLYQSGAIRTAGRVDHQNAFLDNNALERRRGITIFAKEAVFPLGDRETTLLDTPGHVDFSAEMERTLGVLDCAVLVISGVDGVQSHTRTLWRLLERRHMPVFLFINKIDLPGPGREAVLAQLRRLLSPACADFSQPASAQEAAAECSEALLERYLAGETIADREIAALVEGRQLFPCFFGSALRLEGIDILLEGLARYAPDPQWPEEFAARVFKVRREGGERLTFLKITGGSLRVRTPLPGPEGAEKVNQIRLYSGSRFTTVDEAEAGTVCAVTGLAHTRPGQGLGKEADAWSASPSLEPVLAYRVLPQSSGGSHALLAALRQLEEEDPQLAVTFDQALGEIRLQLMGEVQLEILRQLLQDRFGLAAEFDQGSILYKETIAESVVGIGHFEPLRHYAEVQLLLEPLPPGSGLHFAAACSADQLDLNWQRLVLTHLGERVHAGVLTGSPLTDMRITLIAGRAHLKHTEGGDFRQATYRAVRQGLMGAKSVLLEPYYAFTLETPQENVGRAIADIQAMGGEFSPPETIGDEAALSGTVPAAALRGYRETLAAYTRGRGRLSCAPHGYLPCREAERVIAAMGYDPERDLENTGDSVFCEHGAGVTVKWDRVGARAHIPPFRLGGRVREEGERPRLAYGGAVRSASEQELEEIFVRTYGPIRNRGMDALRQRRSTPAALPEQKLSYVQRDDWLLVDGYNIIFAWDELRALARDSLDDARAALVNALCSYQGLRGCRLTVVFDAYRVKGNAGSQEKLGGVDVVYTREGETADMYIERATYALGRDHRVKVATSDGLEQVLVLGHGAQRLSARDLRWEVAQAALQLREYLTEK